MTSTLTQNQAKASGESLFSSDPYRFADRHIGLSEDDFQAMLDELKVASLDDLINETVPAAIRLKKPLELPEAASEHHILDRLRSILRRNQVVRSLIGMGYHDCVTPTVILRNVMENPGWYTSYTPYQAELSQGRLEAMLNFQTMVMDLTGLEIANASLLDEGSAAAEAMAIAFAAKSREGRHRFLLADNLHPQTIDVIKTRAEPLGIKVDVQAVEKLQPDEECFAVLFQYPGTDGVIHDFSDLVEKTHQAGALAIAATDLMALTLLKPPGEFGADIAVGNSQRFGVPLGYGGPHAAFLAARESFRRQIPGRLVGVSHDSRGRPAYRLSLQTREQHIRREKATSNICTAQVLLAVMASMYAIYHGPEGLRNIARRIHGHTVRLAETLRGLGFQVSEGAFFDTFTLAHGEWNADTLMARALKAGFNLRRLDDQKVGISLDETISSADVDTLASALANQEIRSPADAEPSAALPKPLQRQSDFLTHPVFNSYHTETEMLRYLKRLENRDLSLVHSMIPLGSCTMKLNATTEMIPVTWPETGKLHPFAPHDQAEGYLEMIGELENWLKEITGFQAISLQPNAGSQGEFSGLLAIRAYHQNRGEGDRNICIIPQSAHGTNPASAIMAGMKVVGVKCDARGDIDLGDFQSKLEQHRGKVAALMITYPSTHGVFEETIEEICRMTHGEGAQVYMDGANLNAMLGLCRPGDFGVDICHLNLHKTFCIPHGGGGPGVGPVAAADHLAKFLPGHPYLPSMERYQTDVGPVCAAPWGSASILVISWTYLALMGEPGLTKATKAAILSANYIAKRIGAYYPVLFRNQKERVAHECVVDCRQWKQNPGIEVEDIAKRLMDYGFHAPTVSWPVPGTMMIEPTESESKAELDRFCQAMISIHGEIRAIQNGEADTANNVLKNAPHTADQVSADQWDRPYGREAAAYPASWLKESKFWPPVSRIDNVYGDRNPVCSCPPVEAFEE